jgi:hypothetical protein
MFPIQLAGRQYLNVRVELFAKLGFGVFDVINRHIPNLGHAIMLNPEGYPAADDL